MSLLWLMFFPVKNKSLRLNEFIENSVLSKDRLQFLEMFL